MINTNIFIDSLEWKKVKLEQKLVEFDLPTRSQSSNTDKYKFNYGYLSTLTDNCKSELADQLDKCGQLKLKILKIWDITLQSIYGYIQISYIIYRNLLTLKINKKRNFCFRKVSCTHMNTELLAKSILIELKLRCSFI